MTNVSSDLESIYLSGPGDFFKKIETEEEREQRLRNENRTAWDEYRNRNQRNYQSRRVMLREVEREIVRQGYRVQEERIAERIYFLIEEIREELGKTKEELKEGLNNLKKTFDKD